jgi:hypothetical protein
MLGLSDRVRLDARYSVRFFRRKTLLLLLREFVK